MAEEQTVNTPQLSVNEENGKAIAEALANQQILNETPKDESFKAEPFFKEEETEAVVETKEEVAEKQELNEDGTPKATETKEVEIKETPT
jgi:hypothetical protein